MKRLILISAVASAAIAAPALAQGQPSTIERGRYVCELPGNAAQDAGIEQQDENFTIISASRYRSDGSRGTYLRRGNVLTMTSGPRNGDSYIIESENFLRKLDTAGIPTRLRCIRSGR